MKVKVTLEFNTPEEAIKFLGDKVMAPLPKAVPDAPRKQRADIGKPRGAYKKAAEPVKNPPIEPVQATSTPASAAPEAAAPDAASPLAEAPTTEAPVAAAPVTDAEMQEVLQAVLSAKGMPAVTAIFEKYGVKRGREVAAEKRAEFVAHCKTVLA